MSSDLLESVLTPERLNHAWRKVSSRGGVPGGDGVSINRFSRTIDHRLADLRSSVLNGAYQPGPLRRIDIPKPGGETRTLSIPCVRDRVLQTAVSQTITPRLDSTFSPASFGWRPGRSVAAAADRLKCLRKAGFVWVAESDIKAFFDSIDRNIVRRKLQECLHDDLLLKLILKWTSQSGAMHGISQGSPISPLLANLYLDEFDRSVQSPAARLVRYGDDFVFACRSRSEAEAAVERANVHATMLGLTLNVEKTRVASFADGFDFLGDRFVRSFVLPKRARIAEDAETDDWAPSADSDRFDPSRPALRILYLNHPNRALTSRRLAFSVIESERQIATVPADLVDRIEIGPSSRVSNSALRLAFDRQVSIAFVDGRGRTRGICSHPPADRAALHLEQARCLLEPKRRIDLARRIVAGRIVNQAALLRRIGRRRDDISLIRTTARRLRRAARRALNAESVEEALGIEGAAAAEYWPAWASLLSQPWTCSRRQRRPSPDPVNFVLSYLSSMLYRDIASLALRHGLHPGFGALHGSRDGHNGCASDLIEEFRAPLVESLTLYLFNNRMFVPEMFPLGSDGGCRAVSFARGRIIAAWERSHSRIIRSPRTGRRIKWRRLVEEQVLAYSRHIREVEPYVPYAMDW